MDKDTINPYIIKAISIITTTKIPFVFINKVSIIFMIPEIIRRTLKKISIFYKKLLIQLDFHQFLYKNFLQL